MLRTAFPQAYAAGVNSLIWLILAVPRELFRSILDAIDRLRVPVSASG